LLHNIPEAIAVVVPMYYSTKSAFKSFAFTFFVTGFTSPIGGLIAFAFATNGPDAMTFGILYAITSGMMTFIIIHDIIPAARSYDKKNKLFSIWFFIGIIILAGSIALFQSVYLQ
jgi:zinc transporter ZupT